MLVQPCFQNVKVAICTNLLWPKLDLKGDIGKLASQVCQGGQKDQNGHKPLVHTEYVTSSIMSTSVFINTRVSWRFSLMRKMALFVPKGSIKSSRGYLQWLTYTDSHPLSLFDIFILWNLLQVIHSFPRQVLSLLSVWGEAIIWSCIGGRMRIRGRS